MALAEPNYRLFTIGNIFSLIGTWIQRVTLGWVVWDLTGSGVWLGAVAFADMFPMVLVTPFAGAMADRSDRLRVTKVSQSLLMLQAALLAGLSALGMLDPGAILALALAGGVITAFNQPFRMALLPSLVERPNLVSAVAINSIVFNTARFIGPAVAGAIIAHGSITLAFAINFVTFALFWGALARIRIVHAHPPALTGDGLLKSIAEGIRFSAEHTGLGVMFLTLIVVSILARPILELMPSFAALFGADAAGFAVMTSAIGLGALSGATWLSRRNDPRSLASMALSNGLFMGATLLIAALTSREWVAVLALVALGWGMVVSGIASQTVIQLVVPNHLRGRVLSIHTMIFRGAPALGALAMGAASDLVGLRWPLATGAIVTFAFSGIVFVRRKAILKTLEL